MIRVTSLTKDYGTLRALDHLDLHVDDGEIVGFVGANGAGKSTTMRIIMGSLISDEGEVLWIKDGQQVPMDAYHRRLVGYMPEERGLYPKMKVADQLTYLARLHGLSRHEATSAANGWMERLAVEQRAGDEVQKLSLGNQQRVQLAAALVSDPELLVLDEPFSGLDPVAVDVMSEVLRERAQADVDARRAAVMAAGGQWLKAAPCTLPLELDTGPESLDYQCACARNYWGHRFFSGGAGKHPRSVEARTAWLRSNGGEREAWSRGQPVGGGIQQWTGQRSRWTAQVLKQGDVWQVNLQLRLAGRWQLGWRLGYEIDNARNAHPRPGFDKRACLTWSMRPERRKP